MKPWLWIQPSSKPTAVETLITELGTVSVRTSQGAKWIETHLEGYELAWLLLNRRM